MCVCGLGVLGLGVSVFLGWELGSFGCGCGAGCPWALFWVEGSGFWSLGWGVLTVFNCYWPSDEVRFA